LGAATGYGMPKSPGQVYSDAWDALSDYSSNIVIAAAQTGDPIFGPNYVPPQSPYPDLRPGLQPDPKLKSYYESIQNTWNIVQHPYNWFVPQEWRDYLATPYNEAEKLWQSGQMKPLPWYFYPPGHPNFKQGEEVAKREEKPFLTIDVPGYGPLKLNWEPSLEFKFENIDLSPLNLPSEIKENSRKQILEKLREVEKYYTDFIKTSWELYNATEDERAAILERLSKIIEKIGAFWSGFKEFLEKMGFKLEDGKFKFYYGDFIDFLKEKGVFDKLRPLLPSTWQLILMSPGFQDLMKSKKSEAPQSPSSDSEQDQKQMRDHFEQSKNQGDSGDGGWWC
jgi:hypothetical protein